MKRLLILFLGLLLAGILLASCSSGYTDSESTQASSQSSSSPSASAGSENGAGFAPGASSSPGASVSGSSTYGDTGLPEESLGPLPILTPSYADGKKMIYTITLRLQTTEFMKGMRKLLDTVSNMGGYTMNAYVEGHDMRYPEVERRADYEFKIPSERLSDFIVVLEDNYNLWSLRQETEDSTIKYDSAGLRLEDLLEQESRLLDSLSKEEDSSERLSLERKLSEVQRMITDLYTLQVSVDDAVILSTVNIQLFEVIFAPEVIEAEEPPPPPLTFSERLGNRISGSIDGFVSFCQGLLIFVIAIAPVLVVLAVVGAIAYPIVRVVRNRGKKRGSAGNTEIQDDSSNE